MLILRNTWLGPEETTLLGNALSHLPNLELLNVGRNHIGKSVVNLCKGFNKLKYLKEVNMTNSALTDKDKFYYEYYQSGFRMESF